MPVSFSVIVTTYNSSAFVNRAIESLKNQTLPPMEVLIVDDCSSDNTIDVIKQLITGDERFRIIALPVNGGPSAARNAGIGLAGGEWIATLDADDAYAPERLEKLSAAIEQTGPLDMVADDLLFYDSDIRTETGASGAIRDFGGKIISLPIFFQYNLVNGQRTDWGLLKPCFRRAFLTETGQLYPTTIRHGEDFLFFTNLLLKGARWGLVDQPLYIYTQRVGSVSQKLSEVTRTTVAYGALAKSALNLTKYDQISSNKNMMRLLTERANNLMKLDDAHFFSVAIRRKDIKGLLQRAMSRPVFVPHVVECVFLAVKRRVRRVSWLGKA
ncbi:glycosyltransferase family 2 protein [Acetobacter oeni]|uniref:Glycosyltransferase 2-like domain-containing protein n=1 Tax=Acetobacter oeni TaxID=304077 RepID=A0A511XFV0_9PROT|nr:glycosyltransferase [Acetobacter oeni]MBB3882237.1 succinoglycan biosynthesis protein ExoO [Acetobacter oeni]NHO17993.1 glycosyltransferase [Acetobacter oeni]GBR01248.1 glycosyltransferase [Acetobacter oeni LMG 21952]GEN61843.1 hypothetical protein AOE01nite_00670 [Acetobacter oeni]